MDLVSWITTRGGIVHRDVARRTYTDAAIARAVRAGGIERVRRHWLAAEGAPADLLAAARAGGRVACLTFARRRKWWMPEGIDTARHLSIGPHARRGAVAKGDIVHWTKPVGAASPHSLEESVEDALAHIALCADLESALVIWESAIRIEGIAVEALRHVRWTTRVARRLAQEVTGLSDSGLETYFRVRLGPWGLPIRHQPIIAGRPVDFLIGERLIVQIDGYAHHSSSAQRTKDVAFDAELRLRGYTVLRFTYAQVLHDWPAVERAIARALAAGLQRPR